MGLYLINLIGCEPDKLCTAIEWTFRYGLMKKPVGCSFAISRDSFAV